ncbi:hypothetical protein cypCar_00035804, partial [Cyprinus carpio]
MLRLTDVTAARRGCGYSVSTLFCCCDRGKGSSSISSDVSSSTDHTPTKAPKNVATSE